MISNLEDIKSRTEILSVVEAYLPLKKQGNLYRAHCPFHSERTPSFMVNANKNLYFCFGCNEGGDAFSFVQKINHCGFNEAVEEVARICRLRVEHDDKSKALSKTALFEAMDAINEHFKANLNEEICEELRARGLSDDDIAKFEFGFCQSAKLLPFLNARKLLDLALKMGVVSQGRGNSLFCIFDGRITLPIRSERHKVIAFSGRIRQGIQNPAKYINSKENFFYKKNSILFNLSNAKTQILKLKEVILCEGYFDVLALRKFGYENAIATCGTAFSLPQLCVLHKFSSDLKYILSFDKDNAGENANLKTLELFFKHGFFNVSVRVISKKVKDFGDLLRLGVSDLSECFRDYNGFEYYIKLHLKRANGDKEKIYTFFKQVKDLINIQANFFLKDSLMSAAAEFFGVEKRHFINNTKPTSAGNPSLLSVLVRNILINEKAYILAQNYFKAWDFKEYGKDLKAYFDKGVMSSELMRISCDENLKILSDGELSSCFKAYKKELLKQEMSRAKARANVSLVVELSERLRELA